MEYKQTIYDYLMAKINNKYGVCGLMGNLQAESGLHPDRKQGDIPYSEKSKEYTNNVDNGTISEYTFVNDSIGYGLAQWTFHTRKQALYNLKKSRGCSIGDINLGLDYLWQELTTAYVGVLTVLQSCTSLREASDKVLHDFENPKDQSEQVEIDRAQLGQAIYDSMGGVTPTTDTLYDLIEKTSYNTKKLSDSNVTLLKALKIGSSVNIAHSFNKRKSEYGINFFGKRLTKMHNIYIIRNVRSNGFVELSITKTSNNLISINPAHIREVKK